MTTRIMTIESMMRCLSLSLMLVLVVGVIRIADAVVDDKQNNNNKGGTSSKIDSSYNKLVVSLQQQRQHFNSNENTIPTESPSNEHVTNSPTRGPTPIAPIVPTPTTTNVTKAPTVATNTTNSPTASPPPESSKTHSPFVTSKPVGTASPVGTTSPATTKAPVAPTVPTIPTSSPSVVIPTTTTKHPTTAPVPIPTTTTAPVPIPTTAAPIVKPTYNPVTRLPVSYPPVAVPTMRPQKQDYHTNTMFSIFKIFVKTIVWCIIIFISVLVFGACMSHRYRIYYWFRSLWYTIQYTVQNMACTTYITSKLQSIPHISTLFQRFQYRSATRTPSISSRFDPVTIMFDNDVSEGLLMREREYE